jgi:large subunit ribosomal protein L32e
MAEETAEAPPADPGPTRRRRSRASQPSADQPATAPTKEATPTPKGKKGAEKAGAKDDRKDDKKDDRTEEVRIPKRAALPADRAALLRLRRQLDRRRPVFGRQAANRYYRIGRDGSWRRPRGLQSKQRRHYGYRAELVSIGYGSPAAVRGLTPSGYRPVLVHHVDDLTPLDPKLDAAIIARTVGTRRRLGLEDAAKKRGIHVLNPIATPGEE